MSARKMPDRDIPRKVTIVGRCQKCGRGYIMLPGDGVMIDRWAPPGLPAREFPTEKICGGDIVPGREEVERATLG